MDKEGKKVFSQGVFLAIFAYAPTSTRNFDQYYPVDDAMRQAMFGILVLLNTGI